MWWDRIHCKKIILYALHGWELKSISFNLHKNECINEIAFLSFNGMFGCYWIWNNKQCNIFCITIQVLTILMLFLKEKRNWDRINLYISFIFKISILPNGIMLLPVILNCFCNIPFKYIKKYLVHVVKDIMRYIQGNEDNKTLFNAHFANFPCWPKSVLVIFIDIYVWPL